MATRRVIAYFMHESEEVAATTALTNHQRTESYVIGDLDEGAIAGLEAQGLVVQPLEPPTDAEVPGRSFNIAPDMPRTAGVTRVIPPGAAAEAGDAVPVDRPTYYLVQLREPLLEPWRDALKGVGVELLEHVPRNSYKALLTLPQVADVQALDFVESVRLYTRQDTGVMVHAAAANPASGRDLRTFDVRLQPGATPDAVLQWLEERHVLVAGAKGRKVRLFAFIDSPLLDALAGHPDVDRVEEYVAPTLHNDIARRLLGVDSNPGGPGLGLTGQGQIVAVADTGLDETHPDFQGRIVGLVALGRPGDPSDPHGHGTHVAGSVLGDGAASNGQLRGTAPEAQLFFQSLLDSSGGLGGLPLDLGDLFLEAYEAGARIHNNSWGAATRSMYTMNSAEVDEFVASHRDMLIVISAGNEGTAANPRHAQSGFVDWLSIGSPASAKNALVVGASRSSRNSQGFSQLTYGSAWPDDFPDPPIASELISSNPDGMAAFSSRGPCDDRRIKPDLVAPGTDIVSAKSSRAPLRNFWGPFTGNPRYALMGGTSMSAPLVAGCAALVRQYFADHRHHQPSAALLKATLINGTFWLPGADSLADHPNLPNFHQGFGRLQLASTLPNTGHPALSLEFRDTWQSPAQQFTFSGQRFRYQVNADTGDLRCCLVWTDAPDRGVQNSLVLMMEHLESGQKWVANADVPLALLHPDPDNNVQLVRISNAPAGTYLLQVFARNLLKPAQDFALVVAGHLTSALSPF